VIPAAVSGCCRRGRNVPHGVKLLTRAKRPVPVVPPVCLQSLVVADTYGRPWAQMS